MVSCTCANLEGDNVEACVGGGCDGGDAICVGVGMDADTCTDAGMLDEGAELACETWRSYCRIKEFVT